VVCTNCGKETEPASKFCAFCGANASQDGSSLPEDALPSAPVADADSHEPAASPAKMVASPSRPWVRFWARVLDVNLFALVVGICGGAGIIAGLIKPNIVESVSSMWLGMGVVFAWIFVEALLLSTVGNTPGKWFLKTKVFTSSGDKLNFSTALTRSFRVWFIGLGAGIPVICLITQIVAYHKLKYKGITIWDGDDGLIVTHERIGVIRTLATIVMLVIIALSYVGNV